MSRLIRPSVRPDAAKQRLKFKWVKRNQIRRKWRAIYGHKKWKGVARQWMRRDVGLRHDKSRTFRRKEPKRLPVLNLCFEFCFFFFCPLETRVTWKGRGMRVTCRYGQIVKSVLSCSLASATADWSAIWRPMEGKRWPSQLTGRPKGSR